MAYAKSTSRGFQSCERLVLGTSPDADNRGGRGGEAAACQGGMPKK